MKHLSLLAFALILTCCKKDDKGGNGTAEGKKIETGLIGQTYTIASIKDQTGADASSKFAPCLQDDRYYFKDRGTVEISQGVLKCGKETADKKSASWGVGYDNNSVSALQLPFFSAGADYYQTKEFPASMFSVDYSTQSSVAVAFRIKFETGASTYTITFEKSL